METTVLLAYYRSYCRDLLQVVGVISWVRSRFWHTDFEALKSLVGSFTGQLGKFQGLHWCEFLRRRAEL